MRRSVGRRAPGVALALLIITMSAPVLGKNCRQCLRALSAEYVQSRPQAQSDVILGEGLLCGRHH